MGLRALADVPALRAHLPVRQGLPVLPRLLARREPAAQAAMLGAAVNSHHSVDWETVVWSLLVGSVAAMALALGVRLLMLLGG